VIRRALIVAGGLAGAVTTSQAPELMQQYKQRLGGAAQELTRVVEDFDADAASAGLSRPQALERFDASGEEFFRSRGVSMDRTLVRFERITAHRQALADATAFERPALFWKYRDPELFEGTLADYRPAVPTTAEGAVYAFIGFVLGSVVIGLLLGGLGRVWLWLRRPENALSN